MLKSDSDPVLTTAQRAFLDEVHYAVVGTLNRDGSIQQTVVWFLLDGDELHFSIGAGSVKAANLRRNPAITLTIEDGLRYLSLAASRLSSQPTTTCAAALRCATSVRSGRRSGSASQHHGSGLACGCACSGRTGRG